MQQVRRFRAESAARPVTFNDVADNHWAAKQIKDAAKYGFVIGAGDGQFRPGAFITRAEVVTLVNRVLGRSADTEYVAAHASKLVHFSDMQPSHWAYLAVHEAANEHHAVMDNGETWK